MRPTTAPRIRSAACRPSSRACCSSISRLAARPTSPAAARDAEGGKITQAAGVLASGVVPVTSKEVLNLLNSTQLGNFNFVIDAGGTTQVSPLTLSEKWEGMALVSANDPAHPHDYFLFVANDNDFLTSTGMIQGPNGLTPYDGFIGYDPETPAGQRRRRRDQQQRHGVSRVPRDVGERPGCSRPLGPADGLHRLAAEPQDGEGGDRVGVRSVVRSSARFVRGDRRERRTRTRTPTPRSFPMEPAASTCCCARSARRMAGAAPTRSPRRRPTWSGTSRRRRRRVSSRTTRGIVSSGVRRIA